MPSKPSLVIPGEVIVLKDDDMRRLGAFVCELLEDLESQNSTLMKDIPVWWKWKNATPAVKVKTFPFQGASNVVVPLIRTVADATTASMFGKIFAAAPRIWTVKSQDEDETRQTFARAWDRELNWAGENTINLRLPVFDAFDELAVIGSSVLALNWRHDKRHVFFGRSSSSRKKLQSQLIEWTRGPIVEHSPRETFLWDTRYRIADAPIVSREHAYSFFDLEMKAAQDIGWNKTLIEEIRKSYGNEGNISSAARDEKNLQNEYNQTSTTKSDYVDHDIREVHIDLPLAKASGIALPGSNTNDLSPDAPWIPLVIHVHRKARIALRVVAEPYHIAGKPFYDFYYRKFSSRGSSIGVAKMLHPMAELESTLYNQAVDSATRMNAIWAKTRNKKHVNQPFDISRPILVSDMGEFEPLNISTQFVNNLPLIQAAQSMAERVSGVNDPLVGRETRAGGHPAPATSTLALLGQQDKMSAPHDELIREQISAIGRDITVLYQQFETDDDQRLRTVHGKDDAEQLEQLVFPQEPIQTNYMFDVRAMSPGNNPDQEMKRVVVINQMTNDYWAFVLRIIQTIESNPQLGPTARLAALQSIESKTKVFRTFLEASNEDDIEGFVAQLQQSGGAGDPNQLNEIAGTARQLAGSAGAVQGQGAVGGAPTGPPGGTAVTPPGGGVLIQ